MIYPSLLQQAHARVRAQLQPGDVAIDATVGNGHDTLFLAQQVAPTGWVYGFDVQAAAIQATAHRLDAADLAACVQLRQIGHQFMSSEIPAHHHGRVKAVMFNLGYLPHGDKSLITQGDTTLIALKAATALLCAGGLITILAYPGHAGGETETARVVDYCRQLTSEGFALQIIESQHPKPSAPRLLLLIKNYITH